ncbi:hypothetical protein KSP39_PZI019605 [Platanthera zijinensis]|uniref:Annexin n=1 Tax=Platanthera zijinensis TaxID=2320716 RepID=A0AAP0B1I6_9ASPA
MSPTSPFLSVTVEEACRDLFENRNRPRTLIRALARRSPDERRGIKASYRAVYGEELVEGLRRVKEANPESEQVWSGLWLWMMEPPERDAAVARDAVGRGGGDDYNALVEIYVLRKSSHLFSSKQAYLMRFGRHLDSDLLSADAERQGSKILAALAASHRSHHDHEVSRHIGNCDAKRLHEALKKRSEGRMEESSTVIVEIFSKRSIPQLRLAFSSYRHIYGHDFIEALETVNGEFEESLRVVIQCMCTPYTYYSEMIHLSLTADATKKTVLTRVMIGSAEAGMEKVKAAYERRYNLKLEDAICERVSDDEIYRDFLLDLSNGHG